MKQIFDWLRGAILDKAFKIYDGTIAVDVHDVGELINEAEIKRRNDCCIWKWRIEDGKKVFKNCLHLRDDHIAYNFTYCPYCGKPRKEEVE